MQIILHIGTDKTGSTSLQSCLYSNRDWFLRQLVYIPRTCLGTNNGHGKLLKNNADKSWKDMDSELATARSEGYARAILSWEGMAAYGAREIKFLHSHFKEFELAVVIYIREQADILQTGHLQQIKTNSNTQFIQDVGFTNNLFGNTLKTISLRLSKRNYYNLLMRWEKGIPGVSFIVRVYDKNQLFDGDVVLDFVNVLGLKPDSNFVLAEKLHNISLDVESALFIESLQKQQESEKNIVRLIDLAESYISLHGPQTKYFLSPEGVKRVRKVFKTSNRKMARRYLNSKSEVFPNRKDCWKEDSFENLLKRSSEIAEELIEICRIPVLIGTTDGDKIPLSVSLVSGWCKPAKWGIWSNGDCSVLKFQIPHRHLKSQHRNIRIILFGRYYGENTHTEVTVNGKSFGERNLVKTNKDIALSPEELSVYGLVNVQLRHLAPITPKKYEEKNDLRQLAFGLSRVGFAFVD